jgi:hypothetical protein
MVSLASFDDTHIFCDVVGFGLPLLRLLGIGADGRTAPDELMRDMACAKSARSHPFAQLDRSNSKLESAMTNNRLCHAPLIYKASAIHQRPVSDEK